MGEVWVAEDTKLGRRVALKTLPVDVASDPQQLARFHREAKALAALNHPNIVTIYSVEEVDDQVFLAMELVEGQTLSTLMESGELPLDTTVRIALRATAALAAAHDRGITHRDLKPDNVMIAEGEVPKILDFGLARVTKWAGVSDTSMMENMETLTREGSLLGSFAYMSPEQAHGRTADSRSDVFSLGIILYEMIAGRRPFEGGNFVAVLSSIVNDEPPQIRELRPSLPEPLAVIVDRCLEKDAAKRFIDAGDLHRTLAAYAGTGFSTSTVPAAPLALEDATTRVVEPSGSSNLLVRVERWLRRLGGGEAAPSQTDSGQDPEQESWARSEGLPRLEQLVERIQFLNEGSETWLAFGLASELERILPGDPALERLWPKFTCDVDIHSKPSGAKVAIQHPGAPNLPWTELGQTPLESVRYPRGFTRIRWDKPGFRRAEDLIWDREIEGDRLQAELFREQDLPGEMERVPAGSAPVLMPGLDHQPLEPTAVFLIDRDPVTNADFKRFLDDGGYQDESYWPGPFLEAGRELTREEAMSRFVDSTSRPGPAAWEVGDFPAGEEDYPVGGVSWYEAAAYAAWAGKSLPTLFHWNRVAYIQASSQILPLANLSGSDRAGPDLSASHQSSVPGSSSRSQSGSSGSGSSRPGQSRPGPIPIGESSCYSRYGVRDLAGNVREWIWNACDERGNHFILGGGWNDPPYAFNDAYAQPGFDRSPTNGFRCMKATGDENPQRLRRTIERPVREFLSETPVSDEVFAVFLRQFTYDDLPLDAEIESEETTEVAIRQKVSFRAAYGHERVTAYVFLPKASSSATGASPAPFQTVVLFPGSDPIHVRSSAALQLGPREEFLVKAGRAVVFPIYKGTFERGGDLTSDYPSETTFYKDYLICWAKDLSRTIDYLETREDLDADRLAYYGLSWGAALGAILPAVERRLEAVVLYVAGFMVQRALPEVDAVNYVGRVTQPTLMLNGELDYIYPLKTSQEPMYELLGTPEEHKRWKVYPGGHSVPRTEMIKEILAWLDKYLGPV